MSLKPWIIVPPVVHVPIASEEYHTNWRCENLITKQVLGIQGGKEDAENICEKLNAEEGEGP